MSRIFHLPSFSKQIEKLKGPESEAVEKALIQFYRFVKTGEKTEDLGFKKIASQFYEIRSGIRQRIAMRKHEGDYYLMIYGSHDDIQKFLKNR